MIENLKDFSCNAFQDKKMELLQMEMNCMKTKNKNLMLEVEKLKSICDEKGDA